MRPLPDLRRVLVVLGVAGSHARLSGVARLAVLVQQKVSAGWVPSLARRALTLPVGDHGRLWLSWLAGRTDEARSRAGALGRRSPRGARQAARWAVGTDDAAAARVLVAGGATSLASPRWVVRLLLCAGEPVQAIAEVRDRKVPHGLSRAVLASTTPLLGGWVAPPAARGAGPTAETSDLLMLLTSSLPHSRSGYTRRSQDLLAALRADGLRAEAATRLDYPLVVGGLGGRALEHVAGVPYHRLRGRGRGGTDTLSRQTGALTELVDELGPAVLHTTTAFPNGLCVQAVSQRRSLPWVYEVRGFLEDTWAGRAGPGAEGSTRYRSSRQRETECMLAASVVVTIAGTMKDEVVARGVPADKVVVVPNAVSEQLLQELGEVRHLRDQVRRSLGIHPDDFVVGTLTSVVDYEGLPLLARAVAAAPRSTRMRLLVAGDGAAMPALRDAAAPLGDRALILGRRPRSEVAGLLTALDAFAVPRVDSLVTRRVTPLKPLEAMAARVPVVASDLEALREVCDDGRAGVMVAPGSVDALLDGLVTTADGSVRAGLVDHAERYVRERRTWPAVSRPLQQVYAGLVG